MYTNFTGYDVIVRDEASNVTLFMGKVASYDELQNLIEINFQPTVDLEQRHMRVLLYHNGRAYTYHGTFRKGLGIGQMGIALYKGSAKTDRKNERFSIDLGAEILEHRDENGKVLFQGSTPIHIMDISRSGLRIQATEIKPGVHEKISIRFTVRNVAKTYYARVVRVGKKDEKGQQIEYGCELLTMQEYMK
ncbi:MAG: PilZ domain-containing protein [Lachnospiraceae bacterium]|nr:PilZ domain-containing protein [Lachnospiraceae bacterium]